RRYRTDPDCGSPPRAARGFRVPLHPSSPGVRPGVFCNRSSGGLARAARAPGGPTVKGAGSGTGPKRGVAIPAAARDVKGGAGGPPPDPPEGQSRGGMSETIWYLKRCPLFERLGPEECRRLEARSLLRAVGRGQVVYFPAEPGEAV